MAFFGDRNTGSNVVNTPPANSKAVSKFTLDIPGTVDHVNIVFSTGASSAAKAVIYADSSGAPGTLLGTSDEIALANGLKSFPFTVKPTLAAGTYWVGIISGTANTSVCLALTGGIDYNSNTYASGPSSPFGTPSTANFVYPVNVAFTPTLTAGTYLGDLMGGDTLLAYTANKTSVVTASAPVGGTVSDITFYADKAYASAKVKGVIYDATGSGGAPGALLGTTPELTGIAINRNVLTFSSPVTISSGTFYFGLQQDTSIGNYTRSVANSGYSNSQTYASGPANPFGTATATSGVPVLWATFAPSAGRRRIIIN